MGSQNLPIAGNILGGIRAEIDDKMLDAAFVETYDFQALTKTRDYNFVVGRRGTGKSALFIKVSNFIIKERIGWVYKNNPEDYEQMALRGLAEKISEDYNIIRAIFKVAWTVSILVDQLERIALNKTHYKFKNDKNSELISSYFFTYQYLIGKNVFQKTAKIVSSVIERGNFLPIMIPGEIATHFLVNQLKEWVASLLKTVGKDTYYFFDSLDEGWEPDVLSTAILGGLAQCAAEILDSNSNVHLVLFVRDNMFRSLCYFDGDSSRHIEGNALRLSWDEESLLHLVTNRLRVNLGLQSIESHIKVWNRFAASDLKDKDGFRACLNYTLYRPRDIIVLLNTTFAHVARSNRTNLVAEDIENSSKQVSQNRLDDLKKEYDTVFPGLTLMTAVFNNQPAFQTYAAVVSFLDEEILGNSYDTEKKSDYAIIGSGKEAFFALYSIGFLGLTDSTSHALHFCHDGSSASIDALQPDQTSCVHPCYWKSLNIQTEKLEGDVLIEVYDDNPPDSQHLLDLRTKRIGQIISNLPSLKEGKEDAGKFEEWVFQAVKVLFAGQLVNPELKANKDSIQRRDIIATNNADSGFWKRVLDDYKCRQIVIEVKNFEELTIDVFRQALSYSGNHYGKFIIVVYRDKQEGLSNKQRGWVKEFWDQHGVLVFLLPAPILSRCMSKLRNRQRFDYTENQLSKRLDIFQRSYLSLRHVRKSKKKR